MERLVCHEQIGAGNALPRGPHVDIGREGLFACGQGGIQGPVWASRPPNLHLISQNFDPVGVT